MVADGMHYQPEVIPVPGDQIETVYIDYPETRRPVSAVDADDHRTVFEEDEVWDYEPVQRIATSAGPVATEAAVERIGEEPVQEQPMVPVYAKGSAEQPPESHDERTIDTPTVRPPRETDLPVRAKQPSEPITVPEHISDMTEHTGRQQQEPATSHALPVESVAPSCPMAGRTGDDRPREQPVPISSHEANPKELVPELGTTAVTSKEARAHRGGEVGGRSGGDTEDMGDELQTPV